MSFSSSNRVVVTGMGIVSPCGIGLDAYWDALIHCKSGIGPITLFDTTNLPLKIAGEVKDFNLRDYFGKDCKPHRLARQTQLGLVACKMALEDAGLTSEMMQKDLPVSLVMGICSAGVDVTEQAMETVIKRGPTRVRPHIVGSCQPHAISAALIDLFAMQTSITTISSACPSGLDAVAFASKMIKEGRSDIVIVGSTDSPLNISTASSFYTAGIPPVSNDFLPEEIARPFDAHSCGGPMSEGAGFLVVERIESALARGAQVYAEVLGGATMTDPPGMPPLSGLLKTMRLALDNSGVSPSDVDYICANAISHLASDLKETELIKEIFGRHAYDIPVSSIKGVTGNPLAAAGIFQAVACMKAFLHETIPPTANLNDVAPGCDLDYVPLKPRHSKITHAMMNMHGMAGENSTLILKRI